MFLIMKQTKLIETRQRLYKRGVYTSDLIERVLQMISDSPDDRGTAYEIFRWCNPNVTEQDELTTQETQ